MTPLPSSSIWKTGFALLCFAAFIALLGWQLTHAETQSEKAVPPASAVSDGKAIPAFTLPLLNEGTLDSAALTKDGPVLLNFFASWCTPCKAELPLLGELKAKGLPVVGIAWHDKPAATSAWLDKNGSPYRETASDEPGKVGISFGLRGIPESFLIGKDGTILYHHTGPVTPADLSKLLSLAGITVQ